MAPRSKLVTNRRGQPTGRVNPRSTAGKAGQRKASRYTQPIPTSVRRSPRWYPFALLGVLGLGVLIIILNYVNALPSSPTNWYTLGGLIAILVAAVAATSYH